MESFWRGAGGAGPALTRVVPWVETFAAAGLRELRRQAVLAALQLLAGAPATVAITFRAAPEEGSNIATTVEVDAMTLLKSVLQEGLRRANTGAPLATVHLKVPSLMHMDAKCNVDSATDAGLAPWSADKSGGTRWCHWMAGVLLRQT